jgi:DNA repair exonuclease SbcCD ATPase subunit
MTRFTLKGAAAIIEDHQKSIRELESDVAYLRENGPGWLQDQYAALRKENDALKALNEIQRDALTAQSRNLEKAEARIAELESTTGGFDCPNCGEFIDEPERFVKKEAPRP